MTKQSVLQNYSGYFSNLQLHGCPCAYYGDPVRECTCTPSRATKYQKRIRGPFLEGNKILTNSEMTPVEVKEFCQVEPSAQSLLKATMKQLHLSARTFHRILKLSRTIADLVGAQNIHIAHIAEAIQYRPRSLL